MARTREFDEEGVLRAAREVFWVHGYGATSMAQLEAATGLSRSSLYGAFGNKRELFERALRSYVRDVMTPLLAPVLKELGDGAVLIGGLATAAVTSRARMGDGRCSTLHI